VIPRAHLFVTARWINPGSAPNERSTKHGLAIVLGAFSSRLAGVSGDQPPTACAKFFASARIFEKGEKTK
jgi:hypothetical protein